MEQTEKSTSSKPVKTSASWRIGWHLYQFKALDTFPYPYRFAIRVTCKKASTKHPKPTVHTEENTWFYLVSSPSDDYAMTIKTSATEPIMDEQWVGEDGMRHLWSHEWVDEKGKKHVRCQTFVRPAKDMWKGKLTSGENGIRDEAGKCLGQYAKLGYVAKSQRKDCTYDVSQTVQGTKPRSMETSYDENAWMIERDWVLDVFDSLVEKGLVGSLSARYAVRKPIRKLEKLWVLPKREDCSWLK